MPTTCFVRDILSGSSRFQEQQQQQQEKELEQEQEQQPPPPPPPPRLRQSWSSFLFANWHHGRNKPFEPVRSAACLPRPKIPVTMQNVLLVLTAAVILFLVSIIEGLRRNVAVAKKSNLPYVIVPCFFGSPHWLILAHTYARLIKRLPTSWWDDWLDLLIPDACYHADFDRYTRHGEILLLVSPGSLVVTVASAEAMRQITSHREKFPKPTDMYAIMKLFGENVITSEGAVWKTHRKATSASFNEKNAALVFREIIVQTHGMMGTWVSGTDNNPTVLWTTVSDDIKRLTLHIICYVGFGLRLLWPGQTLPPGASAAAAKYASLEAPRARNMSFIDTLMHLMHNVALLYLVPIWLLRLLPWERARHTVVAHGEYVKYLDDMLDERVELAKGGKQHAEEGMDIMGALVKGSVESVVPADQDSPTRETGAAPTLTRDEILGNAFAIFTAGHETSANTIYLTLINLAVNPSAQRLLHRDIDELVGKTDPSSWDFERLMGPMSLSAIGACMNETLRTMPPAIAIPKCVRADGDEVVSIDGYDYVLPKGAVVMLQGVQAHKDPRNWPYRESKLRPGRDDLREYKPERWFETEPGPYHRSKEGKGEDEVKIGMEGRPEKTGLRRLDGDAADDADDADGVNSAKDANEGAEVVRFFRPRRGAFMAFSDGARSCPGRRVAQVEVMTFLTVLLQGHSLELAPDAWASKAEVDKMDREARAGVYKKAQAAARQRLAEAKTVLALSIQGKPVPMRLVKRGEEKFVDWISDA